MKKGEAKANGDAGGGLEENRLLSYTVSINRKEVKNYGWIYLCFLESGYAEYGQVRIQHRCQAEAG